MVQPSLPVTSPLSPHSMEPPQAQSMGNIFLPSDVLLLIFLNTSDYASPDALKDAIAISHTCRWWRTLAVECCPRLWAAHAFDGPLARRGAKGIDGASREYTQEMIRRAKAVMLRADRSWMLPSPSIRSSNSTLGALSTWTCPSLRTIIAPLEYSTRLAAYTFLFTSRWDELNTLGKRALSRAEFSNLLELNLFFTPPAYDQDHGTTRGLGGCTEGGLPPVYLSRSPFGTLFKGGGIESLKTLRLRNVWISFDDLYFPNLENLEVVFEGVPHWTTFPAWILELRALERLKKLKRVEIVVREEWFDCLGHVYYGVGTTVKDAGGDVGVVRLEGVEDVRVCLPEKHMGEWERGVSMRPSPGCS